MFGPISKIAGTLGFAVLATLFFSSFAAAQALTDYQMWHQPAASPGMEAIIGFDILTFWIITPITIFVTALLAYVCIRFRASANPVPSKTTHNTILEVIWTAGPVVILLILALPSFKLLTSQFEPPEEPSITIKATGYQWYWGFEYQGENELSFETRLIGRDLGSSDPALDAAAKAEMASYGKSDIAKYPRLLAVDNEMVVPVGKVIRVLVTAEATGVIHNFAMPAFGLKMDAIPGRINEVFFKPTREGLYYGQCSELCGRDHAFMPKAVRVVSEAQYQAWFAKAQNDLDAANRELVAARDTNTTIKVAGN